MARKFGKKNHVNLNPLAYNICLLGEAKVGKTTLIKNVCEKLVGEDGYIFLEFDKEHGADAIEGIMYENVLQWQAIDEDEDGNKVIDDIIVDGVGFEEIIDDIIENKTTDYKDLKVVIWDTYDQIIPIAEAEAIRLWNKEVPADKKANSINAAWGGFGKGEKKAIELMFDAMERLRRVGVQTIVLGHVKTKDVTDVVTGETYQTLTSDQQNNYFNALKKNLHFLGLAYIDRTIVKEKTGKKNVVTKKEEIKGKVKQEVRKIKFRDDNFCVDSGSRFADIVPEINLDADEFIEALTNAIKAEQLKSGKTFEETKAEQEEALKIREKNIAEAEEKYKNAKEVKTVIDKITNYIKENKTDMTKIKPILTKCKELGYGNPTEITSLNDAEEVAQLIK